MNQSIKSNQHKNATAICLAQVCQLVAPICHLSRHQRGKQKRPMVSKFRHHRACVTRDACGSISQRDFGCYRDVWSSATACGPLMNQTAMTSWMCHLYSHRLNPAHHRCGGGSTANCCGWVCRHSASHACSDQRHIPASPSTDRGELARGEDRPQSCCATGPGAPGSAAAAQHQTHRSSWRAQRSGPPQVER